MPIRHNIAVRHLTDDEFHRLDYQLMGLAFAAHKELGRLCDEDVYREFLSHRCLEAGFESAATEVPVVLSHEDFSKRLFIDLLLNDGVIYELKAVSRLVSEHQVQLLNYLLITGIQHGKLINLRPSSVEHRFVSTRLTPERQREFDLDTQNWRPLGNHCSLLNNRLEPLLCDWGVFLEAGLYTEALTHFLGGEEQVVRRLDIMDGVMVLGRQRFHLIDDDVAFRVTAVRKNIPGCQAHLQRLLSHTRLKGMHWINLNQHDVTLRTLMRDRPLESCGKTIGAK